MTHQRFLQVIVFLLELKQQVAAFFVEIGWLVLWLLLLRSEYDKSKNLDNAFTVAYPSVWKFITLLAIWRFTAVARYAFKRWLSLKFYHKAHYADMMVRSVK